MGFVSRMLRSPWFWGLLWLLTATAFCCVRVVVTPDAHPTQAVGKTQLSDEAIDVFLKERFRVELETRCWSIEREQFKLLYPEALHSVMKPPAVERELAAAIKHVEFRCGSFREKPVVVVGLPPEDPATAERGFFLRSTKICYIQFAELRHVYALHTVPEKEWTLAHELTHWRVSELAQELGTTVPHYINEGLAHFVGNLQGDKWVEEFRDTPHWPSKSEVLSASRKKVASEDVLFRVAGTLMVSCLAKDRRLTPSEILRFDHRDIPEPREALAALLQPLDKQRRFSEGSIALFFEPMGIDLRYLARLQQKGPVSKIGKYEATGVDDALELQRAIGWAQAYAAFHRDGTPMQQILFGGISLSEAEVTERAKWTLSALTDSNRVKTLAACQAAVLLSLKPL